MNPWNVAQAAEILRGSDVKVCTVVGFPLGATLPEVKVFEAQKSIERGAQEIDMVINIGALKSGRVGAVEADIHGVVTASHHGDAICKVIIETCLLTREEKIQASLAAKNAGADFVKTSTGFSTAGATPEDVRLIRETDRSEHRHQSRRRRPHPRRPAENGRGRRHPHRRQRRRQNHRAIALRKIIRRARSPFQRQILKTSKQAHLGGKPSTPACYNEMDFARAVSGVVKMPAAERMHFPGGGRGVPRHNEMDAAKLNPKIDVPADALKILAELSQEINASLNLDEVSAHRRRAHQAPG